MTPSSRSWLTVGAWLLLLGSVADAINSTLSSLIPGPIGADNPPNLPSLIVSIVTALVLLVSVPVLYVLQRKRARVLSLIGVIFIMLAYVSILSLFAQVLPEVFGNNSATQDSAAGPPPGIFLSIIALNVVGVIGLVIEGIAILRARVFPGAIAWMFFAGALLLVVAFFTEGVISAIASMINTLLIDLGLLWCAVSALRMRATTTESTQQQALSSQS